MSQATLIGSERRGAIRLSGIQNMITLDWPAASCKCRSRGNLLNASYSGALVVSDVIPPIGERVLVRLEEPFRTDWVMASVVRHDDERQFALRFEEVASYAFVLSATIGIDLERALIGLPDSERFSHGDD